MIPKFDSEIVDHLEGATRRRNRVHFEQEVSGLKLASWCACAMTHQRTRGCGCCCSNSFLCFPAEIVRKDGTGGSHSRCNDDDKALEKYDFTDQQFGPLSISLPRTTRWSSLVLATSVLLVLMIPCHGLQFSSLFDRTSLAARHAAQVKQRAAFHCPPQSPQPPCPTTASEISLHFSPPGKDVAANSETLRAGAIEIQEKDHIQESVEVGDVHIHRGSLAHVPSPELSFLSDSWWEDESQEAEEQAALVEQKRNRMIAARRGLLLDGTTANRQAAKSQRGHCGVSSSASSSAATARKASARSTTSQVVMGAIRKAAMAAGSAAKSTMAAASNSYGEINVENCMSNATPNVVQSDCTKQAKQNVLPSRSIIESSISDLLDQQLARQGRDLRQETIESFHRPQQWHDGFPIGFLGDDHARHVHHPMPGTVLLDPSPLSYTSTSDQTDEKSSCHQDYSKSLTVRVATPWDDVDVALLRLSVFSDFSPEVRQQFCSRSCEALANRRLRGATCLVATTTTATTNTKESSSSGSAADLEFAAALRGSRPEIILGTVECSFHEFKGTTLGRRRPERSILYITEFAVSPTARRRGIGSRLLQAVDQLANLRQVESLYLHVDVTNHAALALYHCAGYKRITSKDAMFDEFTMALNLHDRATKGRRHFLLCKHLSENPTWLPISRTIESNASSASRNLVFGFEIPVS